MPKALITGITGQDGSYLAEFLLDKEYEVHGIIRRSSSFNTERIEHIYQDPHEYGRRLFLHYGDLADANTIRRLVYKVQPDEIYNLGAQSVAEECLCPILSAQKMEYRTLGDLWNEQVKKKKKIKIENFNGVKVEVIDLARNSQLKALGMWNGMGTWFPIKQISRHWWSGKIAKMSQKFGSILVTPNHSVLDADGQIRMPKDNPWLLSVRKLNYKPNKYKNEIKLKIDGVYKKDNFYFWLDEKGVPGKVLRNISEDKLKPLCRFMGAFIAEGHTTFNKANRNWYVGISNGSKKWLEELEKDLKVFYEGKYWYIRHKKAGFKDTWELQIKSRALHGLFQKLLGADSKTKQLPFWFSQIKENYLREMWEKILEGDGNLDSKSGFRYTTASYKLACQLSWLFTVLNYDYTVAEEKQRNSTYWHFRECISYQPNQGSDRKRIEWIDYDGWVYDITVNEVHNFAVGVGNIVVHNSHVRTSFDIPEYTANVTGVGTLRMLEAIKDYEEHAGKKIKFYQASSSEMFGNAPPPQNENTPFHPRSPYAASKVFSHHMTKNYREAYGIFAVNGVLFNHETVAAYMPMFVKRIGEKEFDIKPIREIVEFDEHLKRYQSKQVSGIQVWGKNGWVDVTFASAYPHDVVRENKQPRFVNFRSGAFMTTSSHVAFMADGTEKRTGDIAVGDRLEALALPPPTQSTPQLSEEEAELIGMMVGDGSYTHAKRGIGVHGKFTNSSPEIRARFDTLWCCVTNGYTRYHPNRSGFKPENVVGQLILNGNNEWLRKLDMYNRDRTKRVPKAILNSSKGVMYAFLRGYNATDGLKSNPCVYEFRNFKTNSPTLAMGIWYLVECVTEQEINLTIETKEDGRIFYSLNLLSTVDNAAKEETVRELVATGVSQRGIERTSGISRTFIRKIQHGGSHAAIHHLRKDPLEVKKIIELYDYNGWFYDLETTSGEFHCGVGKAHVHNSPRRGETFVTKKITRGIARIKAGLDKKIYLGNLGAKRDWGYAPEFIEAMWLMLQQPEPDDYVIGTGESHSVREFVELAFKYAGIFNWRNYVEIDPRYFRPTEVDNLIADPKKAKEKLGWESKTKFPELVKIMLAHDLKAYGLHEQAERIRLS